MSRSKDNKITDLAAKNKHTVFIVFFAVLVMICLSFASVPLYNLFCRTTGFGGTTQIAQNLPEKTVNREITVRFDTNISGHLPWIFRPEQKEMTVKLGQRGLANFIAHNKDIKPTAGTALFNVTPLNVGKYFQKIQCFCFDQQILQSSQTADMPVLFFVDPALDEDVDMKDVSVITLSYTFFPANSAELDNALEEFYENAP